MEHSGRKVIRLEEVDSTNEYAKRMGLEEGTVVLAKKQTGGKGRGGKEWISPEGGLWFSVVLKPQMSENLTSLTLVMGMSVARALSKFCEGIHLEWPNDVFLQGKKLCGILCELSGDRLIVGIGINLNNVAPEKYNAISLSSVCGHVDEEKALFEVLYEINTCHDIFRKDGFAGMREEWKEMSSTIGKRIIADQKTAGIVEDINEEGCLVIRTEEGKRKILPGDAVIAPYPKD